MEIFAFTQNSVGYEDPGAEPQLRSFDEINLEIPKSAIAGAVGTAAAVAVIGAAPDAHALVRPGAQCPAVATIQQAVGVSADTVYGPVTTGAVRAFQSRTPGLMQDGIVGPNTARALGLDPGISCGSPNPGSGGGTYRVTTSSGVKVRVSPSTSAAQVFPGLGSGATVGLTNARSTSGGFVWAETSAGNWVAIGTTSGRSYLVKVGSGMPTPPQQPGSGGGTYRITTPSGVKIRSSATNTFNNVVGGLSSGQTVGLTNVRSTNNGVVWAATSGGNWVAIGTTGGRSYMTKIN